MSLFLGMSGGLRGTLADSDASAFLTAAGITDNTQKTAINDFVAALKNASIWSKMLAIYPFVGGSAAAHKFNLKDPQDTNGAYRLAFGSGVTHSSAGMACDGTASASANTNFQPSTGWATASISFGFLLGAGPSATTQKILGAVDGLGAGQWVHRDSGTTYFLASGGGGGTVISNALDFVSGTTDGTNSNFRLFANGSFVRQDGYFDGRPARDIHIGKQNNNGSLIGTATTTWEFFYLAGRLTDGEMASLYTAVDALQTALSR